MSGVKKALGAEKNRWPSVAPTVSKKEDALNLGADEFIATRDWSLMHTPTLPFSMSIMQKKIYLGLW